MEFGIYTFAETSVDPLTGAPVTPAQRLADLLDEIELADRVGLDVYGVGEHHRADFAVSAPAVVLAAAAARTSRIRLTSAVTVLSSDDPVRVYQQFATLDLISRGRAEVMAGRGSFVESFPLFGYDLADYDALFAEKLELLLAVNARERVSWPGGGHRPAIDGLGVYPRAERELPIWIAVGGTPQSLVRAGALGLPLALAIIGGQPERFGPLVALYRQAAARAGHADRARVGINVHGFVADDAGDAVETFWPSYRAVMSRIGRERGWPGVGRDHYEAGLAPDGHLVVGDPDQVVEKILALHRIFGHDRFMLQMTVGSLPQDKVLRAVELYGTVVAPRVRAALGREHSRPDRADER